MLVNGCPVVIRGVNRHEHHPRVGKTNLEACMIKVALFCQLSYLKTFRITISLARFFSPRLFSGINYLFICDRIWF